MTHRKPVATMLKPDRETTDGETIFGSLIVICDDGATFSYNWKEGGWSELEPIPGTKAALAQKSPEVTLGIRGGISESRNT